MFGNSRGNARMVGLFATVAAVVLAATICPAAARASSSADAVAYADIDGTRCYYATVDEAVEAGYQGATIVMYRNWDLSETFEVADSKTLTLDMNGHKITGNGKDSAIRVHENADFTLKSSVTDSFYYVGFNNETGEKGNMTISTGGLVTGGHSVADGGGITMDGDCNVTLRNVAVAGNDSGLGGGILCRSNSTLKLEDGSTVTHNKASQDGGGIFMSGSTTDDITVVHLDNASVSANYAACSGGGIDACVDNATIYLQNKSTVSDNTAQRGGGIFCDYAYFHVISKDRTGSIDNNKATSGSDDDLTYGGGGIFVNSVRWSEHFGEISGVTLKGNNAVDKGGAIFINQPYTHVSYCQITDNGSNKDGGGIYVNDDNCSVTSCNITDNVSGKNGTNYEGGGIFVYHSYDLTLDGLCTIKGNTRCIGGSADDLFLSDGGFGAHAYILGGVDAGSEVGIRTGMTDDQMVGKKISTYSDGTYFMDIANYHVTHGSDHDGDLWQRVG